MTLVIEAVVADEHAVPRSLGRSTADSAVPPRTEEVVKEAREECAKEMGRKKSIEWPWAGR